MKSIYKNGFSIEITKYYNDTPDFIQKILYRNSNYYTFSNDIPYSIVLSNSNDVRADAHVWINDYKLGIYRVNPRSIVTVSTYKNGDLLTINDNSNTYSEIIKVEFVGEKYRGDNIIYTNPTRNTLPDVTLAYPNCNNNYTDGTTPSNINNRRCAVDALNYELNYIPKYGNALFSTFVNNMQNDRYSTIPQIKKNNINKEEITTIYTRIFINKDYSFNKNPYFDPEDNNSSNPSVVPPDYTSILKKMARHKCPSYYNRTFELDNNMCSNQLTNNGKFKFPAFNRYTNGVYGGPSYNSWILGTADPTYVNKNIYKQNNYF